MKKGTRGKLVCCCDKASTEFCELCPQGIKYEPDEIFEIQTWEWSKVFKEQKDIRREN